MLFLLRQVDSTTTLVITPEDNTNTNYVVLYDFVSQNISEITLKTGTHVNVLRKCDKSGNDEWWLVEYAGRKGYIPESFLARENTFSSRKPSLLTLPDAETTSSNRALLTQLATAPSLIPTSKFYTTDNTDNATSQEKTASNSLFYKTIDTLSSTATTEGEFSMDDQHGSVLPHTNLANPQSTVSSESAEIVYILEYDFEALNAGELGAKEGQIVKCLITHDQKGNPEWWLVEYDGQQGYVPRDYLSPVDASQLCWLIFFSAKIFALTSIWRRINVRYRVIQTDTFLPNVASVSI